MSNLRLRREKCFQTLGETGITDRDSAVLCGAIGSLNSILNLNIDYEDDDE